MKFVQEEIYFQDKFWLDLQRGAFTSSAEIQKYYCIRRHVEIGLVHKLHDPDRDTGMNFLNGYLRGFA